MEQPVRRSLTDGITMELWPRAAYEVQGASTRAVIGFAFETQTGVDAIGDRRAGGFRRQANTLSWVPPGCPVFSRSDEGGEYLAIKGVSPAAIGHPDAGRRPLNGIVDAEAVGAASALRRSLTSGRLACDRELHVLAAILLHHFEGKRVGSPWLTASRLATVDRYIDAHMHESLDVARLAAELDLSVGFLVRAFRQSVGTTPHRYVTERRLAHARRLLRADHPIAAVSTECGFADQAHLTRSMKRATGVTPSIFRPSTRRRSLDPQPPAHRDDGSGMPASRRSPHVTP